MILMISDGVIVNDTGTDVGCISGNEEPSSQLVT